MQNRRDFFKTMMIGGVALGTSFGPLSLFASKKGLTKVTILHTNDCHSQIEPFSEKDKKHAGKGGFAERAKIIEKIRTQEEHVLLFDAGDIFQGTPYFNFYNGELEFKLMSKIKYDAATIGNHEFDNGIDNIEKQLNYATFPFVTSNYDFTNTVLSSKTEKHLIFRKGDIRIGVLGLGIELKGLVNPNNYKNTQYLDPVKTANDVSSFLKEEKKCDLVICLSHLGLEYKHNKVSDVVIAEKTKHIDLIIGGHTHTFLNEPRFVKNLNQEEVTIVQAGWGGMELGRLDFYFDKEAKKNMKFANTIKISKNQG